jgi:hypothetical protein
MMTMTRDTEGSEKEPRKDADEPPPSASEETGKDVLPEDKEAEDPKRRRARSYFEEE